MKYKKVLAIDATWMIRRQFHATGKGAVKGTGIEAIEATEDTDAVEAVELIQDPNIIVISFFQSLLKAIRDFNYEYEVVCLFDRGTFRYRPKDKFTGYKESREYDDTFKVCWTATDIAIDTLRKIGIHTIQVPGLEADDLGMYYSHKSEDSVLFAIDSDWSQSITPTTRIYKANSKTFLTYDDVVKDHIKEPFDLAIHKAIVGGHDDLKPVAMPVELKDLFDSTELMTKMIEGYTNRTHDSDTLEAIDYNMNLSRLDKILYDEEVHSMIKTQEALTNKNISKLQLIHSLSVLKEYPMYFLGVLGKYNSLHSK